MMRSALISAITAVIVYYSLQILREYPAKEPLETEQMTSLLYEVRGYSDSVTALELEMGKLRSSIANSNKARNAGSIAPSVRNSYQEIIERIESIEEALSESSPQEKPSLETLSTELKNNFSMRLQARDYGVSGKQFAEAESHFEDDSGQSITAYTDSIDQHISTVEGLDVKGMDCANSICKVTYSKPESSPFNVESEAEAKLVDKMLFGIENRDVDIRYADDPYGNSVIYIEMK